MSNRTDPKQLIGGQTLGTNGGIAAGSIALAWGTVQAVSAPPTNVGGLTPVQAPTNT
jgi:hypothetical protein